MARHRTHEEQRNLQLVLDMFAEVLEPLDSSRVDRFIAPDYIQHNQSVTPGRDAFKAFLDWARGESPACTHDIKRAFVDGDHVIVHYHVRRWEGDNGWAVCDIFRVEGGMIREHWDVLQNVEPGGPNPNSPF
jgi:predicted SnoaL-like aldol condensation-catalyzing enzyme